jgi:Na+-transporting NADH:ubiquinone oxidoreductase subunit F
MAYWVLVKSVLFIVGLAVLLAALLVVAEALLLNYGECIITINSEDKRKVMGGGTLLSSLMGVGIFVPSACGGRGSCGLCKVKVLQGGGPLLPTEMPHLSPREVQDKVRVSCQVKVKSDIEIELPPEILSLREYTAVVEKLSDLNYDTKLVRLRLEAPPEIAMKAGQYIQLETPPYGKTSEPVYRAYSGASSVSEKKVIELIIRRVPNGICTTYVFEVLEEGDTVRINGPYGEFYLRESDREIVFIAGGSGIAPVRAILFQMAEQRNPRKAAFFHGANELRDLYLVDEMVEFEKIVPNFRYIPSVARPKPEDNWQGETGLVTNAADRHVSDASSQEFYLCGPPAMIDAAIGMLKTKGLSDDRTFFDKFT